MGQLSLLFMDMIVTFDDFKAHENQLIYWIKLIVLEPAYVKEEAGRGPLIC